MIQRYFVDLFGICSGDTSSWDRQSLLLPIFCTQNSRMFRFHLLSTFPFQKLDQVALDFTRPCTPSRHPTPSRCVGHILRTAQSGVQRLAGEARPQRRADPAVDSPVRSRGCTSSCTVVRCAFDRGVGGSPSARRESSSPHGDALEALRCAGGGASARSAAALRLARQRRFGLLDGDGGSAAPWL
jgi:hypothetical protein